MINLTKKEKKIIKRNIIFPIISKICFRLALFNLLLSLIIITIGFCLYGDFINTNLGANVLMIIVPSVVLILIYAYTRLYCSFTNSPWIKTGTKLNDIKDKYRDSINDKSNGENVIIEEKKVKLLEMLRETKKQYEADAIELGEYFNITYNRKIFPVFIIVLYVILLFICAFNSFTQASDSYNISLEKVSNQRTAIKQNIDMVFGYSKGKLEEDGLSTEIYDGISSTYFVDDNKTAYVTYEINRDGKIDEFEFHYEVNNIENDVDNINKTFDKFYTIFKMVSNGIDNAELLGFDSTLSNELLQTINSNEDSEEKLVRFEYKNNKAKMSQCYFIEDKEIVLYFK